ncbi:MAG: hypothetical protein F6K30_20575 [Cyanothece sp. SIO2G6]|nr:hypothetical protein [Cyanothece sp. SIO2G6]
MYVISPRTFLLAVDAAPDIFSDNPTDFSETNTQVDGVDESDLVETDGQFIYQVHGQLLTIRVVRKLE